MTSPNWLRSASFLALVVVLHVGIAHASATDPAAFDAAQAEFGRATQGDARAVARANEMFGRLATVEPGNPLLVAYQGAAQTLRAQHTWLPWKKMKYAEEGLDTLDRALGLLRPEHESARLRGVPISIETRLVIAQTFLSVPEFFNRAERGRALVSEAIASPTFATAPKAIQEQLRRLEASGTGEQSIAGRPRG